MWWKGLRETNNEAFLPLFFDQHRYLVLKGGGGSGKSIFAGRKVLERVTSEPGHRWLVTRKVARTQLLCPAPGADRPVLPGRRGQGQQGRPVDRIP